MANDYSKMLGLSDKELIEKIEGFSNFINPPQNYVNELWRRNQAKQTNTLKCLTWWIFAFTFLVMVSTFVQLAITLKWIGQ